MLVFVIGVAFSALVIVADRLSWPSERGTQ